jgi:hypothetical protein
MNICIECGSNILKCHHWLYEDKQWINTGIWHKYDKIEPGVYTCECVEVFSITEDNYQEFEDTNTKPK